MMLIWPSHFLHFGCRTLCSKWPGIQSITLMLVLCFAFNEHKRLEISLKYMHMEQGIIHQVIFHLGFICSREYIHFKVMETLFNKETHLLCLKRMTILRKVIRMKENVKWNNKEYYVCSNHCMKGECINGWRKRIPFYSEMAMLSRLIMQEASL